MVPANLSRFLLGTNALIDLTPSQRADFMTESPTADLSDVLNRAPQAYGSSAIYACIII
jgi:hypothetical protein